MMTTTQAIRSAIAQHAMYRQGGGWITSSYDATVHAARVSHEQPYNIAREATTVSRTVEAVLALRPSADQWDVVMRAEQATGSLRERVHAVLAKMPA